jgi:hypothetical protein
MKLKTIIQLSEWISHSPAVNANPDSKLRPTPGGWNDDSPNWDGIVEGKDWFCYMEGNDWHAKRSGATIYINEDEKPHKMWIKIKTSNLRKPNDTNESYKERVRKHTNKVARSWMSAAKKIHNNPDINEAGNPVPITWKQAFREAMKDSKLKAHLAECGEQEIAPVADPVNFTPRISENVMQPRKISYSAVVLEKRDHEKLLEFFKDSLPSDWSQYAHHMTIKMGELPPEKKQDLGKTVKLTAYEFGKSDLAIAVKVKGYWTTNQIAHITLAVNKNGGGKPVDSNKITNWEPLPNTIPLDGEVKEIPFK